MFLCPANIARVEAIDAAIRPKAEVAVLTLMDAVVIFAVLVGTRNNDSSRVGNLPS